MNKKSIAIQTDASDLKSYVPFRPGKRFIESDKQIPYTNCKRTQTPKSFSSEDSPYAIPSRAAISSTVSAFLPSNVERFKYPVAEEKSFGSRRAEKRRLKSLKKNLEKVEKKIEETKNFINENKPRTPGDEWLADYLANLPNMEVDETPNTSATINTGEKMEEAINRPPTPGEGWLKEYLSTNPKTLI